MRIFANPNFNFIKWRWHALALSLLVIARRPRDDHRPTAACRSASTSPAARSSVLEFEQPTAKKWFGGAVAPAHQRAGRAAVLGAGQNEIMVRLPLMDGLEQGASLDAKTQAVEDALQGRLSPRSPAATSSVRLSAGSERKGIYATIARCGIMTYIALRFRPSFGDWR